MAVKIGQAVYRNIQEQVAENANNICELIESTEDAMEEISGIQTALEGKQDTMTVISDQEIDALFN